MFERYTEKARRIIFFARYEASQYGSPFIEIPHLLLGLLREDFPTVARVASVDRATMQKTVAETCTPSGQKIATSVDLPLSHACRRALAYGAEEAQRMGHSHIGPEHLLLGVLRLDGPEVKALAGCGIELENARTVFGVPASRPETSRDVVAKLLAQIPEERLEAAARILSGLASEFFAVGGVSGEGTFSYSFGDPGGAPVLK